MIIVYSILMITLAIKLQLFFSGHIKALNYILEQDDHEELFNKHMNTAYCLKIMLNPFKWTYKQMFKELENEVKIK